MEKSPSRGCLKHLSVMADYQTRVYSQKNKNTKILFLESSFFPPIMIQSWLKSSQLSEQFFNQRMLHTKAHRR